MISGGCPWLLGQRPLHHAYGAGQSQLQAAVAFLHAHPDTKLISVDIGSNDLIAYENACGLSVSCIVGKVGSPTTPGTLLGNLTLILVALRQAAPHAAIVVFNYYNPQALDMPVTDTLLAPINAGLTQLATTLHDPVADAFGVINIAPGTPAERFGVCFFTWECTSYHNIHPTQAGYAVMAFALAKALRPPSTLARAS
jgi:lysophospholipase L1-like esterase